MNTLLESIGRALFRSLFVEYHGFTSFEESEWGPIPRDWKLELLGDWLSKIETGGRPEGGVKEIRSGIPSVGAENIIGVGRYDFDSTKYVPNDYFQSMKRGRLENYDVLLYKDGGKPGQFEPHISLFGDGFPYKIMCINEHVYRLRTREPISQFYLYFWLSSPLVMEEMRRRGTGVAIPSLNSTSVKELPLLIPDKKTLKRFDSVAEPLIARILLNSLGY
jgi:type I restriction enzyme S subunit